MDYNFQTGLAGDLTDDRDFSAEAILGWSWEQTIPAKYSLLDNLKTIKNQWTCGSCTAFGTTIAHEIMNNKEHWEEIQLNAQYLFDTYQVPNWASCANGDYILNAVKAIVANWSLAIGTSEVYKVDSFVRIYDRQTMSLKSYIAKWFPVIIGMNVMTTEATATWWTAWLSVWDKNTGEWIRDPKSGWHCMCVAWYDDDKQHFIVAQSWWSSFGDNGIVYIPYDKMEKYQYNSTYILYDSKDIKMLYKDVSENAWYVEHVKWAVDHGFMTLNGEWCFRPEEFVPEIASTINRATLATIIHRWYGLKPDKFNA